MKLNTLITMLVMLPAFVFGQHEFKSIRDTSAISCARVVFPYDAMPNPQHSYKGELRGLFYIVEKMPEPKLSINGIEQALKKNLERDLGKNKHGTMYFQCIVNCEGKAGDFQIIHCSKGLTPICNRVITILREQVKNWTPGTLQGKNVDVHVKIQVKVDDGKFKIVAPLY